MSGIPYVNRNPNKSYVEHFQSGQNSQNNNSKSNPVVEVDENQNQFIVDGVAKFTRTCPHAGCPLSYNRNEKQFVCPCHNSRFNLDGNCIRGPACPNNIKL